MTNYASVNLFLRDKDQIHSSEIIEILDHFEPQNKRQEKDNLYFELEDATYADVSDLLGLLMPHLHHRKRSQAVIYEGSAVQCLAVVSEDLAS